MGLISSLVAQVVTQNGDDYERGTAYPIRPNVILTARHVVPDLDNFKNTAVRWLRDDAKEVLEEYFLEEILYESKRYDVLVARCKTPENTQVVELSKDYPRSHDHWDSCGYARSGKDSQKQHRFKDPAKGSFFFAKDDDCIQQLSVIGDACEAELWRGMSGAPVFLAGENKLVAVIIKTPRLDEYDNPVHENRLYATSIPYVLKHCKKFQAATRLDDPVVVNAQYLEQQVKKLEKFFDRASTFKALCLHEYFPNDIEVSKIKSTLLAEKIKDEQLQIIQNDDVDNISIIADLISEYLDEHDYDKKIHEQAESLFVLTLSLLLIKCPIKNRQLDNPKAHYVAVLDEHTLELIAAQLYGSTPRLVSHESASGAKGRDMMCIKPIRDTGWEDEQVAEAAAKTVFEHVLPGKTYSKRQLPTLNNYLQRRRRKNKQFHYCMVNLSVDESNELIKPEVVERLKAKDMLSALPIFIIGEEAGDMVAEVSAMIYDFYQDLSEYVQKAPEVNTE